jgi:DNA (cytosine-5)-methyltransferase 1
MKCVDLFAGLGGFSTGATLAGADVVWAGNHWPAAVEVHARNHPTTQHVCQDLQQADWSQVPAHDLLLASPCCQGHAKARGKPKDNPQHDASRSTAWAVVSAAEYHRPAAVLVENVPEFADWTLFPSWRMAMEALGYSVTPHVVDAADHGVPQHRVRLFLVCVQGAALKIELPRREHVPASSFVDFAAGAWSQVGKVGRAEKTLANVVEGRRVHGDRFLLPYYGATRGGRSLANPVGTITTRDRHAVIDGDRMRMLSATECRDAMGFPSTTVLPASHREAVHMLGNAVCPPVARDFIEALQVAA